MQPKLPGPHLSAMDQPYGNDSAEPDWDGPSE